MRPWTLQLQKVYDADHVRRDPASVGPEEGAGEGNWEQRGAWAHPMPETCARVLSGFGVTLSVDPDATATVEGDH